MNVPSLSAVMFLMLACLSALLAADDLKIGKTYVVLQDNGVVHKGRLVAISEDAITLRDAAGKETIVPKDRIEEAKEVDDRAARTAAGTDSPPFFELDRELAAPEDEWVYEVCFSRSGSLAFSPGGTHLVSGSKDKTIKLWHVATGVEVATVEAHAKAVESVAISFCGRFVASAAGEKSVKLWRIPKLAGETGNRLRR